MTTWIPLFAVASLWIVATSGSYAQPAPPVITASAPLPTASSRNRPNPLFYVLPEAGVGYGFNAGVAKGGVGYHAGASLLLKASEDRNTTKYYGIQASYLWLYSGESVPKREEYLSVGIVLTMEIRQRFQATIGTVGYVGLSNQALNNPFGITTRLQYRLVPKLPVYTGLRSDFIFSKQQYTGYNALTVGLTL